MSTSSRAKDERFTANSLEEAPGTLHPLLHGGRLLLGPLVGVTVAWFAWSTLGFERSVVAGVLAWMATWWLTLATELATTALLPVILLPALGVSSFAQAAAPYADGVIFLFAGGFILSIALERYGLSDRFAQFVMRYAGTKAANVVGALMLATALISAFVSNTATCAAMLPIALSTIRALERSSDRSTAATRAHRHFAHASLLGVAYAASIGGVITVIGSPPNAIAAQYIATASGREFSFAQWMVYGIPVALLLLPLTWVVLTRVMFPTAGLMLPSVHREQQGAAPEGARRVGILFAITVLCWLTRPMWNAALPGVRDETIAVVAAVLLFVVPRRIHPYAPLLTWRDVQGLPWGVLVLFGGGLSIAKAVEDHQLATWFAEQSQGLASVPESIVYIVIAATTCFGSELASNTALAATAMPVLGALADVTTMPIEGLAITAALGASLAFMLPVGTPPNAMVFATGHIRSKDMALTGLILNVLSIIIITIVVHVVRAF